MSNAAFILEVTAEGDGPPAEVRLKKFLKTLLRLAGLRCHDVRLARPDVAGLREWEESHRRPIRLPTFACAGFAGGRLALHLPLLSGAMPVDAGTLEAHAWETLELLRAALASEPAGSPAVELAVVAHVGALVRLAYDADAADLEVILASGSSGLAWLPELVKHVKRTTRTSKPTRRRRGCDAGKPEASPDTSRPPAGAERARVRATAKEQEARHG